MRNFKERGIFGLRAVKTKLDKNEGEIYADIGEFRQWR